MREPSGEMATDETPWSGFHILTVRSLEHDATRVPSGENATELTGLSCVPSRGSNEFVSGWRKPNGCDPAVVYFGWGVCGRAVVETPDAQITRFMASDKVVSVGRKGDDRTWD
ncbi:hypothetical protein AG1IA_10373 [Rhizoctonia solani AG-1 IA]|uniref:Uncharacterized protein n=1 Tax=Thanatephorus cucumeris (strain AG1-IA) TaxID=983506 RepID=L8WFV0_THACA|nr:hypothetical protein AG1IA_10373 [Rhizoctonia solani AG-1 IA]